MSYDAEAFQQRGAILFPAVLDAWAIAALVDALEPALAGHRPGKRLTGGSWIDVLSDGPVGRVAVRLIGPAARPVRVVFFDKTPQTNWSVAWHQDRTIAVRERKAVEGFGPWSVKDGIVHVEPPMELLEAMVTLRVHLDDCGGDNGPLKILLGSHLLGVVAAHRAADLAADLPVEVCIAQAGDVWAYSTLVLHASEPASNPGRRRVLQSITPPLGYRVGWNGAALMKQTRQMA